MPARIPPLTRRILSRLASAQALEPDPWMRDDLEIAHRTTLYAARGDAVGCAPHVLASYEVLGLHPDKVWPAIVARRIALGHWEISTAPKKPAQSVKLWCSEKVNGAKVSGSRAAVQLVLREPTTSVPMAAPSIAALYPNSQASASGKTRRFTYQQWLEIIEFSGAPHSIRQGTLSALKARGPWPDGDGPATGVICVSLIGMMLHGGCCRSTARWRARRACKLGFWKKLRDENSWSTCPKCGTKRNLGTCDKCGYVGRAKTAEGKANFEEFCRPFMYEIDIEKFRVAPRCRELHHIEARTYAEFKSEPKRANVTEMPSRKPSQPTPPPPPAPAAPLPHREKPAAEHRGTERMSRDARQAIFNAYVALKRSGMAHETALGEVMRQFKNKFSVDDIEFALKVVGYKNGNDVTTESPAKPAENHVDAEKCPQCGGFLAQNRGSGPRLICPKCSS
jgi:hypothetical protein